MNKLIKPIIAVSVGLTALGAFSGCTEANKQKKIQKADREYEYALYDYVSMRENIDSLEDRLDSLYTKRDSLIMGDPSTLDARSFRALLFGKSLEDNLSRNDKKELRRIDSEINKTQLFLDIATGKVLKEKKDQLDMLIK